MKNKMKRKPFGKTIRQEVISAASNKLRLWRAQGQAAKASDAIEAVIDGAKVGTLGGLIKNYVLSLNEAAYRRLECAVKKEAR